MGDQKSISPLIFLSVFMLSLFGECVKNIVILLGESQFLNGAGIHNLKNTLKYVLSGISFEPWKTHSLLFLCLS